MAYEKRVVKQISKEARRRYGKKGYSKAERRKIRSAFQTGVVESGLRNLSYGDSDSQGWRQERGSLYPDPTNLPASVKRYFNEADQLYQGDTAGSLAARVQRPAAQYRGRYGEHRDEGIRLLRKHVLGKPAPGGKAGRTKAEFVTKTKTFEGVDNSDERMELVKQYLLRDRGKPGALLSTGVQLQGLRDTPDKTVTKKVKVKGESKPASNGSASFHGGGGWGGTKGVVTHAVKGLPVSNFKRTPARNAAVGGSPGSDHLTTNTNAYAADTTFGSGARIAKRLGIKGWKPGTYQRYTVTGAGGKKYSVQILERVAGHYDHTHVGVQAL